MSTYFYAFLDKNNAKSCVFNTCICLKISALEIFHCFHVSKWQIPKKFHVKDKKKVLSYFDQIISSSANRAISTARIIKKQGLQQVTDTSEIEKIVDDVLQENQKMVEDYLSGKDKLLGFFVGQSMKKSKGKANPKILNENLKLKLSEKN